MVMVRSAQFRVHIGGTLTHNSRIDRFWREHNANDINHFKNAFERLESSGHLDSDDSTDL